MLKKKRIASLTKKVLAVTLAVATVMMNGYGLQMFRDSEVKAEQILFTNCVEPSCELATEKLLCLSPFGSIK